MAADHQDTGGPAVGADADGDRGPLTDFRGSCTPVITPFTGGAVDYAAFEVVVERQVKEGSHGIVVTGTTGEPTSLSVDEREELYRRAVQVTGGRIPVVAATGCPDQESTLRLTRAAETAGADAVLVVSPAFVKPSVRGLVEHFVTVGNATSLPFMIYNIPGRAGVSVTDEVVLRVADALPTLVGFKHSSADLDFVTQLLSELGDDFRVFCGLESYSYPMVALGAAGVMSAVANLLPRPVSRLCDAIAAGDHVSGLSLHRRLFDVNRAVFFDTNPVPLKYMLEACGLGSSEVRPPLAPADESTRQRVRAVLDGIEPLLAETGEGLHVK